MKKKGSVGTTVLTLVIALMMTILGAATILMQHLVYADPDCSVGKNVKENFGTPRHGNGVGELASSERGLNGPLDSNFNHACHRPELIRCADILFGWESIQSL